MGRQAILQDSVVVVSDNQLSTQMLGEAVILNARTGTYHGVEEVAARIWELLQEPRTVREIHAALLEEYDVDADTCRRDLLGLLQALAAEGLIEVQDETAA